MKKPEFVKLIEVGPRDGFQFEEKLIPLSLKIDTIFGLIDAGLKEIQVASFVNPKKVPQMADVEKLVQALPKEKDMIYTGLVLNLKGLQRARDAGLTHVEISISASRAHSVRNTGMSLEQAEKQGREMIIFARENGMYITAGIQCAFGCVYEGDIPQSRVMDMVFGFLDQGADRISVADTTGMANPPAIGRLMEKLHMSVADTPVILHLHDTRGLGLVNLMTAMECGVTNFDVALGGMGGCPFIPGASGNISTEDTAYLLKTLDVETGIDIRKVAQCASQLQNYLGKVFPGKMGKIVMSI